MATKKILIQVVLDDKDVSKVSKGTKQMADSIDEVSMAQRRYFQALQPTNLEVEKFRILTQRAQLETRKRALAELEAAEATKKSRAQSGLNNAILIELGRTASDASYGFQGMANNIGRLFELGQEFARTGKQKGSLNSALIDLKNSIFGVGGVLIGIQLLIGFLPQISRWFKKTAEEVNKTNEALNSLSANIYVAEQYVDILEQSNLEEGNRRGIIQELIKLVPDLKKEDLDYGENLDLVREKIEDYALAQAARIQIDNLVRENSELLTERARIDRIKNIQSEEERIAEMKKLLEEEGIETERILENTFTKGGKLILENREITDKEIVKLFDDFTSDTLEKSNVIKNQILDLSQGLFSALGDEDGTGRKR